MSVIFYFVFLFTLSDSIFGFPPIISSFVKCILCIIREVNTEFVSVSTWSVYICWIDAALEFHIKILYTIKIYINCVLYIPLFFLFFRVLFCVCFVFHRTLSLSSLSLILRSLSLPSSHPRSCHYLACVQSDGLCKHYWLDVELKIASWKRDRERSRGAKRTICIREFREKKNRTSQIHIDSQSLCIHISLTQTDQMYC